MIDIFEKGHFDKYKVRSINEAREGTIALEACSDAPGGFVQRTSVFFSHKHDDLDDVKGVIGYLQQHYNAKVYIDSQDERQPVRTCVETARKIKNEIENCDKFIFMATEGAIASKWCNWELGYGDSLKYESGNLAFIAFRDSKISHGNFSGNEYMELYPFIVFMDGVKKNEQGIVLEEGMYLRYKNHGMWEYLPLVKWLGERKYG